MILQFFLTSVLYLLEAKLLQVVAVIRARREIEAQHIEAGSQLELEGGCIGRGRAADGDLEAAGGTVVEQYRQVGDPGCGLDPRHQTVASARRRAQQVIGLARPAIARQAA